VISPSELDSILIDWHEWNSSRAAYRPVQGFAPKALVCGDFNISRQWDDEHGMLDAYVDNLTMWAVEKQVEQIQIPYDVALRVEARNLATRREVWNSPRLPQNPDERRVIVQRAREMLSDRLLTAGVL